MGRQADRDAPCAAWLRRRLAAEGLLAVDLAAALGVSPRTVHAWRRGYRAPSPPLRPRLATLLESVGDPPPPLPIGTRRVGPSPASPFARRLGAELGRRGWSPAAFARAAGVHRSLGSRWCRGESAPDRASRAKIAAALGVEPAELERWAEGER